MKKVVLTLVLLITSLSFFAFHISSVRASVLYFHTGVNNDWNEVGNWWTDDQFSVAAGILPGGVDDVIIEGNVISNSGGAISVNTVTLNGESTIIDVSFTVTAGLTMNDTSVIGGADMHGDAVFNDNAVNGDHIYGDVTFNDDSFNQAAITGDVTFNEASGGSITLSGIQAWGDISGAIKDVDGNPITTYIFTETSYNFQSTLSGDVTFQDLSLNAGTVSGDATFTDSSFNTGTVTGDATFTAGSGGTLTLSTAWGTVQGTAKGGDNITLTHFIFNSGIVFGGGTLPGDAVFNGSGANFGTVTGDAIFNDFSFNNGSILGDAIFYNSSRTYLTGSVVGSATFHDFSFNGATIGGSAFFYDVSLNNASGDIATNASFFDSTTNSGNVDGDVCYASTATDNGTEGGAVTECAASVPSVSTGSHTVVNNSSVIALLGTLADTGDESPTLGFEYGLTTGYGSSIELSDYSLPTDYSLLTPTLSCGSIYHYRAFATNSGGTDYGDDATFTTGENCATSTATLYGIDGNGQNPDPPNLYTLDSQTGSILTTIGAVGYYVTGMAFDPTSGILYGTTGGNDPTHSKSLIRINTTTGAGTWLGVIKDSGNTTRGPMPDISFRSDGTLYGNSANDGKLYTIDLTSCNGGGDTNCLATKVSDSVFGTSSLGIAFDNSDNLYLFSEDDEAYSRINADTGTLITNPDLSNPSGNGYGIPAAAFNDIGFLYTMRFNFGSLPADLLIVDLDNSTIASAGNNADLLYMDAIAFSPVAPAVTTNPADSVGRNGASLNGTITHTGGRNATERGFNWGLTDSYGTNIIQNSGSYGVGTFSADILGLACNKTYHFRAYATNSIGTDNGEDKTFTTNSCSSGGSSGSGGGGGGSPGGTPGAGGGGETTCDAALSQTFTSTTALFTRTLNKNSTGEDVRALQIFLNQNGFIITPSGPGSPGNETTFFGDLTRDAVIKFQKANVENIGNNSRSGVISGGTLSFLNNIYSAAHALPCIQIPPSVPPTFPPTPQVPPVPPVTPPSTPPGPTSPPGTPPSTPPANDGSPSGDGTVPPGGIGSTGTGAGSGSGEGTVSEDNGEENNSGASFNNLEKEIVGVAKNTREAILTVTEKPAVKALENVAVTVPVVISVLSLLGGVAGGIPLANYPLYLLSVLGQFLSLKKDTRRWGTVYDSRTKRPLPFARVEILNSESRKLQSTVADQNGRYGFIIGEQFATDPSLRLEAYQKDYTFPSEANPSIAEQVVYPNIYKGGPINTSLSLTNYDLPMDPVGKSTQSNFYLGGSGIKLNNVLAGTANVLFVLGSTLGIVNFVLRPSGANLAILGIILVSYILRKTGFALKPFGLTKDASTNESMSFGFIALHNQGGERVNFTVSDEKGRYFLLTPEGKYVLKAVTPSYVSPMRQKEIPIYTKRGWIGKELKV